MLLADGGVAPHDDHSGAERIVPAQQGAPDAQHALRMGTPLAHALVHAAVEGGGGGGVGGRLEPLCPVDRLVPSQQRACKVARGPAVQRRRLHAQQASVRLPRAPAHRHLLARPHEQSGGADGAGADDGVILGEPRTESARGTRVGTDRQRATHRVFLTLAAHAGAPGLPATAESHRVHRERRRLGGGCVAGVIGRMLLPHAHAAPEHGGVGLSFLAVEPLVQARQQEGGGLPDRKGVADGEGDAQ